MFRPALHSDNPHLLRVFALIIGCLLTAGTFGVVGAHEPAAPTPSAGEYTRETSAPPTRQPASPTTDDFNLAAGISILATIGIATVVLGEPRTISQPANEVIPHGTHPPEPLVLPTCRPLDTPARAA